MALITLSLLSWLFLEKIWTPIDNLKLLLNLSLGELAFVKVVIMGIVFGLAFILQFLSTTKARLLIFFLVSLLFYIGFYDGAPNSTISTMAYSLGNALSFFLLPMCFVFGSNSELVSKTSKLSKISLMLPVWNVSRNRSQAVIILFEKANSYFSELTPANVLKCQRTGRILILSTAAFEIFVRFIEYFVFYRNYNPPPFLATWLPKSVDFGIYNLNTHFKLAVVNQNPAYKNWISLLLNFIFTYSQVTIVFSKQIVIGRMMGISLESNFNEPWKAKGLTQFYGRILHYYNQILMKIFFPMAKDILFFIENRKVRHYLSLFFSVGIGGLVYHFFRDFEIIFRSDFNYTVANYCRSIPYYFFIASIVVVSLYFKKQNFSLISQNIPTFLRIGIYLVVWSIVYSTYSGLFRASLSTESYFIFLRSLIGFW